MRNILLAFILIFYAFLASCSNNSQESGQTNERLPFDKSRAQSFIDSVNSVFSNKLNQGDSAALASLYWPDAELLLDNSDPVKGADILNAWGSIIRMGIKQMNFTTTDITGSAEFIIETGSYEMKDDKGSLADRGKYVVVWEKRNGQWKLYRDIGCTSLPLAKK